ncbi:hypothetical protein F2Q69_00061340 [Brassica cretica]|uniref:Uncharacterized protein n=1 Tax=Brassica cretica TaxID=69181 RepID=A0A8S9RN92_BRACR|nr:hypothetical protein F2Q69_00061340 [Brassica cretica]
MRPAIGRMSQVAATSRKLQVVVHFDVARLIYLSRDPRPATCDMRHATCDLSQVAGRMLHDSKTNSDLRVACRISQVVVRFDVARLIA